MSLLLVALPLLAVGGGRSGGDAATVDATPLAALSTMPARSPQFDISAVLTGQWTGEMCPEGGDPVPISFEFKQQASGEILYSLAATGMAAEGIVGEGSCTVAGEDISFHAFLAMLNSCDDACGVDRVYQGRFESGSLVGVYNDSADEEACASCIGGGTWWVAPVIDS